MCLIRVGAKLCKAEALQELSFRSMSLMKQLMLVTKRNSNSNSVQGRRVLTCEQSRCDIVTLSDVV